MAKTFTEAFGKNAKLMRSKGGTASPFYIEDTTFKFTPDANYGFDVYQGGTTSGGKWEYNATTNNFDYYPVKNVGPLGRLAQQYQYQEKPTKSISSKELGLTDPAYQIAGLATLSGQNGDSWSDYALRNQSYQASDNPQFWQGASDLRKSIGDINGYEAIPSGWDTFMDNAWMVPLMVASAGAINPGTMGTAGLTGGAEGIGSAALTDGALADGLFNSSMADLVAGNGAALEAAGYGAGAGAGIGAEGAGYFGGIGGTTGGPALGMSGTTALPQIGVGAAAGSSSAPSLFAAGELASSFPGAYGASDLLSGLGIASNASSASKIASGSKSVADALGGAQGIGALAGGLLGATSGGAKQAGVTTTTQAPWEPMQGYLLDAAESAKSNYNATKELSPQQQGILSQAQGIASNQLNNPALSSVQSAAGDIFGGKSSMFSPVASITGSSINPSSAFSSLGAVDPTKAYQSLLSGDVTNPYLKNIANDNFTMANRNLLENLMPQINSGATNSGQFGGSRQGIAQGLALSRLNQDVTAANNSMFGNAYQQAQSNMLSAANQLGNFGMDAAKTNAANDLTKQQFNANLGLQNNAQKLSQMNSAMDWLNTSNNMQNTAIKNNLDLANYGNTYKNDALKNYTDTIGKFAGMGGTASQPYYTNPTNNLLGGAVAGAELFDSLSKNKTFKNIFN